MTNDPWGRIMNRKIFIQASVILFFSYIILFAFSFTDETNRNLGVVLRFKEENKERNVKLYNESYALIIGASDYQKGSGWPNLPGVKNDIKSVQDILEKEGFKVTVVINPKSNDLEKAYSDFIDNCGLSEENRLLFYFAGHGYTLKQSYKADMGYIVPIDSPNPDIDKNGFLKTALSMQQIEVYAKQIQSKHAMFIFDSCFSGSIFALTRDFARNISYKTTQPVRQFITSGSAEESVPDKSIFCKQFIIALNGEADVNDDGFVTGSELGIYLQDSVINYSKESQHPQYGKICDPNLDKGDFVFEVLTSPIIHAGKIQEEPGHEEAEATPLPIYTVSNISQINEIAKEAEIKKNLLENAKKNFYIAQNMDQDQNISKEDKAKAWDCYLKDNRASGYEITRAEDRMIFWKNFKAIPQSTPVPQIKVKDFTASGANYAEDLGNGIKLEMIWIPGGSFDMGSNDGDNDEKPLHRVTLDGFWMGKFEITNEQYRCFKPDHSSGDYKKLTLNDNKQPVVNITWDDAKFFIDWINNRSGKKYSLPTEAQWEYACKAGSSSTRYWGDVEDKIGEYSNIADRTIKKQFIDWTWPIADTNDRFAVTAPVGQYKPNKFGLYDMLGNVMEWCQDSYDDKYYKESPSENPQGPASGPYRVIRGGSWQSAPRYCRASDRDKRLPGRRPDPFGFRVVRNP